MSSISQFELTNVLGTMYVKGNLAFTPDGDSLIAPVGNKISFYDLKNHKSRSLCFESPQDYSRIAVSPNGKILLAINDVGLLQCISLDTMSVLHTSRLGKAPIGTAKFSPDGNLIAIGKRNQLFIYRLPTSGLAASGSSDGFEMARIFKDITGFVTSIDWSYDSRLIAVGLEDSPMIHIFSMGKFSNFRNSCFTKHALGLVGVYFDQYEYNLYTICRGGLLCKWICSSDPEEWEPEDKSSNFKEDNELREPLAKRPKEETRELTKFHLENTFYLHKQTDSKKETKATSSKHISQVCCGEINYTREFAVVGFESGFYQLVGLEDGEVIQQIEASNSETSALAFSPKGDWIAIATGSTGEVIVWEWQSESYTMKQQGHLDTIQCLDFSSDGRWVVTGAHDGKVKLWETKNSFSFHTYSDHSSIVTGVVFMQNNKAVLSSSLDGTVRAYDTVRYRNFRVYTTPKPTQFCGVTVDASTTYVASGSVDDFIVFIWHIQSGRLLMEVPGHTAPIAAISFCPSQGSSMLATISWDKTLRIRDSIENDSATQVIALEAEGTALAFRPDGKELAVATLDGCVSFFDPSEQKALGSFTGRYHLSTGRLNLDGLSADKNLEDRSFNAITYSADGSWLLAAGKSSNICVYNAKQHVLIHKHKATQNRGLDGNPTAWTKKRSNEMGLVDLLQDRKKGGNALKLPGTKLSGANRSTPEFQVYATKFSPTGRMWAAATTEGVLVYAPDSNVMFNPIGIGTDISPQAIHNALKTESYDAALHMAIKLNIGSTTTMVLEKIPENYQYAIASTMQLPIVKLCLEHLSSILPDTRHVELHMKFIGRLLQAHIHRLIEDRDIFKPILSSCLKALNGRVEDTADCALQNKYLVEVSKVLQMKSGNEVLTLEWENSPDSMSEGSISPDVTYPRVDTR